MQIDYKKFDKEHHYHYRQDRLKAAQALGYKYISECTVSLYKEFKSMPKVAALVGVSADGISSEIRKLGIKRQGPGGFRPGDRRGTKRSAHKGDVTSL